ncbi:hypothetical protein NEHOM01_2428 [Nematocida homosporus]|uniref:uncharacterized protein n=1 Tax=Nematocida homosporus TaxID=1912981 RepID=UPI00221E5B91|nr:uncharacterized protein NEHOM01_2428 [Nematocida homosporus]KAI5187889.1 hypothetical protein NEHOM01_2428 [Nematocida homosporus]
MYYWGDWDWELILDLVGINIGIVRRLVKGLLKGHNKKRVRLSPSVRQVICECYLVKIPGVTSWSRLVKEESGEYLISGCRECQHVSKIRVLCKRNKLD